MFLDREWMTALRAEPDPRRQVGIFADEMTAIGARVVPLFLMMRAAAAAIRGRRAYQRSADLRWQTMRDVVSALHGVRPGLGGDRAADLVWAIASPETYDLLVLQRGWSPADCAAWVAGAIAAALFDKPGQEQ